jgi:hypothetical protein
MFSVVQVGSGSASGVITDGLEIFVYDIRTKTKRTKSKAFSTHLTPFSLTFSDPIVQSFYQITEGTD